MGTLEKVSEGGQWLSLTDYCFKTGVSLSTLRRRIKKNEIAFRLENGKYFVSLDNRPTPVPVPKSPHERVKVEDTLHLIAEAFEFNLQEKDKEIRELRQKIHELTALIEILEKKYGVRY